MSYKVPRSEKSLPHNLSDMGPFHKFSKARYKFSGICLSQCTEAPSCWKQNLYAKPGAYITIIVADSPLETKDVFEHLIGFVACVD